MSSLSRRSFMGLSKVSLLSALGLGLSARIAHAEHYQAMLCNDCGFGSKKDDCTKCGKWMGSTKIPARLCGDHGFGNKKDNCAKCGKWIGSHRQIAYICNDCGFGSKKDNCVICSRWAP